MQSDVIVANMLNETVSLLGLRRLHPILFSSKGYSLDLLFSDIPDIVFQVPTELLRKVDINHLPATFKFSTSEMRVVTQYQP